MKTAIVPSANSKCEVKETKTPEPAENQLLIKIRASGMCYTDVHQTRGELPGDFPRTLGHEPVGEVVAVGPGVTTRKTGQQNDREYLYEALQIAASGKSKSRPRAILLTIRKVINNCE